MKSQFHLSSGKKSNALALDDEQLRDLYINSNDIRVPQTTSSSPNKALFFKDRLQKKKKYIRYRGQSQDYSINYMREHLN